jgi:hypothetical protein
MIKNPAFEFLREHKEVKQEVEDFVLKRVRNRISNDELIQAFENGISGRYGKVYSLDAQTLIGWVNQYLSGKEKSAGYLDSGLLDPNTPVSSINYPLTTKEWFRETNKAYTAYLNGNSNFHPHIYNHLVMDGKIDSNSMKKYTPDSYPECSEQDINKSMVKSVCDYFSQLKSRGYSYVYHEMVCR